MHDSYFHRKCSQDGIIQPFFLRITLPICQTGLLCITCFIQLYCFSCKLKMSKLCNQTLKTPVNFLFCVCVPTWNDWTGFFFQWYIVNDHQKYTKLVHYNVGIGFGFFLAREVFFPGLQKKSSFFFLLD